MVVTPIHKKGNRVDPENYRAVSLLSIPGKVYCQIILTRIKEQTEGFIKDTQFGFRSGRGTTDAIFITRQIMEKEKEILTYTITLSTSKLPSTLSGEKLYGKC